MNRIDALFADARKGDKKVFVPFLTAGDPDIETTQAAALAIIETARRAGAPVLLELGFPYSDPIADGPTIQASYTRALARGIHIHDMLELGTRLRERTDAPIVAMVSYSLVFKGGATEFLPVLSQAGFDGAVIPDLPVEEGDSLVKRARELDFKLIQLVAPTTPIDRAQRIVAGCTGFLYYISVTGITGERRQLPEDLPRRVAEIRSLGDIPVCIGFGVGSAEQVSLLREIADGVIVGSAIVRRVEKLADQDPAAFNELIDFVRSLASALNPRAPKP